MLQVISRKRATNHTAFLRKMTYKGKASCDSTPPCGHVCWNYFEDDAGDVFNKTKVAYCCLECVGTLLPSRQQYYCQGNNIACGVGMLLEMLSVCSIQLP